MKAQFINENRGIPWSGKDPTKAPVIGKLLTRRTKYTEDGEEKFMEPQILKVVEINKPYYIINQWYKPGVPQVIHDDMVSHYIPVEMYKDDDLEHKMYEMKAKFVNEVLRSEDEWANRQIDMYKKTVPGYSWSESPEAQEEVSPEKLNVIGQIQRQQDILHKIGRRQEVNSWEDFKYDIFGETNYLWQQLDLEDLELILMELKSRLNKIKRSRS